MLKINTFCLLSYSLGLNVMLLYDRERDLFVIAEFVVL